MFHVVATILNLGIHSHRIQRSMARPSRKNSFSPTKGPLPHVEITRQIAFRTLTREPPPPGNAMALSVLVTVLVSAKLCAIQRQHS